MALADLQGKHKLSSSGSKPMGEKTAFLLPTVYKMAIDALDAVASVVMLPSPVTLTIHTSNSR